METLLTCVWARMIPLKCHQSVKETVLGLLKFQAFDRIWQHFSLIRFKVWGGMTI